MEKYTKAQMEVIEFENEDVITASGTCTWDCTCVAPGTGYSGRPGTGA